MNNHDTECLCCKYNIPYEPVGVCPICKQEMEGLGWGGIDGHWNAYHSDLMDYVSFKDTICKKHWPNKPKSKKKIKKPKDPFVDFQDDFYTQNKQFALICSGNHHRFRKLLDQTHLDGSFPYEIRKKLEVELDPLKQDSNETLHQLLMRLSRNASISNDAKNLGLFILGQRNYIAHEDVEEKEYKSRIMLVLHAAALLWPQLPE